MSSEEATVSPDTNVQFHLSIWRDYTPPHSVALRSEQTGEEQTGFQVVTPENGLQAEVYSWPLRTDVWVGISDEEVRMHLSDKLLDRLAVTLPPAERSLEVLGDFVIEAEKAIASGEASSVPVGVGDATVEFNPLLALVLHLKWLIRCFKDRPGISVSIR